MKKIITYITVLAALTAMSCTRVEQDFNANESSLLTLTLKTDKMVTRSAITEDIESAVTQFDWFIYPDATGTTQPVYHGHFNVSGTELTPSGRIPSAYTADTDGTIHLGFNIEEEYTDFTGSYCVYVLANYPGIDHEATDLKLETLLKKTVETNFDELSSSYTSITDFVMDSYSGNDAATYPQLVPFSAAKDDDNDGKANLAVGLRRLAAKISFTINVSKTLTDAKGSIWRPLTKSGNFTTYMVNAVSYATLKGEALDADAVYALSPNPATGIGGKQISYATSHVKTADDEVNDPPLKWIVDQFYTYPVQFDTDSNNAPYLKVALPWENVDSEGNLIASGATLYYYKAYLLDPETGKPLTSFDRNKHYIVTLNIDTLGGTQEDYATLDTFYYVADWQAPSGGTYSGYSAPRFLDVARDTYYIYGDNSITIAVTSSHNISGSVTSVSQKDIDGDNISISTSSGTLTTSGKASFTLTHALNTNLSSRSMDITPITWTVRIYHTDKTTVYKDVTIIQYPSIYGEINTSASASTRFVNEVSSGNVYNNTGNYSLGNVSSSSDLSSDKTVLTISSLASVIGTYSWILGDPRVKLSSLLPLTINGATWNQTDLGSSPDYIDEYLIADPEKGNYIAPRFMLASGLGRNTSKGVWKSNAERCASYQEDGYPAGRWRLPTEAEIEFCRLMQTYGYIGSVFQSTNSYWSSTGRYITSSGTFANGSTSSSCSVRCVYDLWYWGDTQYDSSGNPTTTSPATEWLGFMTD